MKLAVKHIVVNLDGISLGELSLSPEFLNVSFVFLLCVKLLRVHHSGFDVLLHFLSLLLSLVLLMLLLLLLFVAIAFLRLVVSRVR